MTRLSGPAMEALVALLEAEGADVYPRLQLPIARALERRGLVLEVRRRTPEGALRLVWKLTAEGRARAEGLRTSLAQIAHYLATRDEISEDVAAEVFRPPGKAWGPAAKPCPVCECRPGRSCQIMLEDGAGTCVPAGIFDAATCSACAIDFLHERDDAGRIRCGVTAIVWRGPGVTPSRSCPACEASR